MVINSLEFIAFIAIVCLIYFISPKKIRWFILLAASYIFYFASSTKLIVFLIITTLSIYLAALWMGKIDKKTKSSTATLEKEQKKIIKEKAKKKKKWIILATLLLNFGILICLKYANFLGGNLNSILSLCHIPFQLPSFQFVLPLGISYYTLQATSYVLDIYRGKYAPDKHLGKVALFVSFFPQIVEGPIGRYDRLANQLYEPHSFSYHEFCFGIQLIAWGFFKKMVIADRAAIFVNEIFANYAQYTGLTIVIAILLYTLQIYAEFSGCIDIVRGFAQTLGIQMDHNFKRPFFSRSVEEFWRRWNITLGTWLKDYVFFSVSFSKACTGLTNFMKKHFKSYLIKLIPAAFALFFVWFCNGLWHGASWKYIGYGLYYYVIMMVGMILEPFWKWVITKLKVKTETFSYHLWQTIRTCFFVFCGMLIFRAPYLGVAKEMFFSIFRFDQINNFLNGTLFSIGLKPVDFIILIIGVLIMFVVSLLQERGHSIRDEVEKQNLPFRWLLYYGVFFAIIIFGIYGAGYQASSFIYGQF